jgi:succinate dehydrogenase/fumarate reductase flavoprotein subunit
VEELQADVLIIGGGGAGLMAALHASERRPRLKIVLASKGLIGKSGCTRMVQGGYNAVLDPVDSIDLHFADTLKGGQFINDQELAWTLVSEAPRMIVELETKMGCFFDRRDDGRIHQKAFAGQSFDRTVHRGDLTGIEIMNRLRDQLFGREVQVLEETRALDLVPDTRGRGVAGAVLLSAARGQFILAQAPAVVLAAGGGTRMYKISAPSLEKTGDGMAMAARAGAELVDMEMFQFHPTGFLAGASRMSGMVLEEGLRGAGGVLRNALGERFMERYDPERKERSTRDLVSRASYLEIAAGRGTPQGGVLLDVSHLGADFIWKNFQGMVERCLDFGTDLREQPVEVSPTAHFHMGGVRIDTDCRSGVPGLFVAGEDAGGVHGANRLGGNGVAESTVFGARAGDAVANVACESGQLQPDRRFAEQVATQAEAHLGRERGENAFHLRQRLEDLMWGKVGVVRSGPGLEAAIQELAELKDRAGRLATPGGRRLNWAWAEALDLHNMLLVAEMTACSALRRTESRGSHYRTDFPERDDSAWLKNVHLGRQDEKLLVWDEPVVFSRLDPRALAVA